MVAAAPRRHVRSQRTVQEAVRDVYEHLRSISASSTAARGDARALVVNALQPQLARSTDVFFHAERQVRR